VNKLSFLLLGLTLCLFGTTQNAWAEQKALTIYFGGSDIKANDYKSGESPWGSPQLVAQLHINHIRTESNGTYWIDGPPASPTPSQAHWSDGIFWAACYLMAVLQIPDEPCTSFSPLYWYFRY